jgi:hypothetical protein
LPQIIPAPRQAVPLLQVLSPWQVAEPQQACGSPVGVQLSPWGRQPMTGWQAMLPAPKSAHTRLQQSMLRVQGFPAPTQPPEGSLQRPAVAPEGMLHWKEQHWPSKVQTSSYAWQAKTAVQKPPLQLFEQHSLSLPQARPVTLHDEPGRPWQVPLHTPVQHSDGEPQAAPITLQVQVPASPHAPEQHCPPWEQPPP